MTNAQKQAAIDALVSPDFASGNAAINHIIKASSNVELLSVY